MCTAQVLLLNREVMRRNFGSDVNRRVCRKLFETDPNPVGPAVFLKKMQEEIRKRDTDRWNFDFLTETPLPGRYQWEPVFSTGAKSSNCNMQSTTSESNPAERVQQAVVEPIVEEIRKIPKIQTKKKTGAGTTSQHKITDFMTAKKRRSAEESSSSKFKVRRVGRSSESLATTTRLR